MKVRASPSRTKGTVDQESTRNLLLGLYLGHEICLNCIGKSYKKKPKYKEQIFTAAKLHLLPSFPPLKLSQ